MKNLITDLSKKHAEIQHLKSSSIDESKIKRSFIKKINDAIGSGSIYYNYLNEGLWAIHFDISLYQDVVFELDEEEHETIQFIYCVDGNCLHEFNTLDETKIITPLQPSVAHSNTGVKSRIHLQKGNPITLNILFLNKSKFYEELYNGENLFDKKFLKLLQHIDNECEYFHVGNFNPKIALQLNLLAEKKFNDELTQIFSLKGRYYLILAQHIEQLIAEINHNNATYSKLLKRELLKIAELNELIKAQPEKQHSIKNLCEASGLSPAKLQEGFKFMFNTTVADFVRDVRLNKAEYLIKESDLSISEVVYSVGLTSRSYFCKIFKRKYHCSPKEYKMKHAYRSDR